MIGLDTNVVIRYLVQDDPTQAERASRLIDACTETDPGFISLVAVVEIYWVLRRAYKVAPVDCADLLEGLVNAREIRVDRPDVVRTALTRSRSGADFADALIADIGRLAGCVRTVTFDQRATGIPGMALLNT